MDTLVAFVLELLLDGSVAGAKSRKVPLAARVVLAVLLFALLGGGGVFFLWIAAVSDVRLAVRLIALAAGALLLFRLAQLVRALVRR